MQILALLKTFIYLIASSLFLPVLAILSCLFVWMVIHAGGFFRQWLGRRRLAKTDCLPQKIMAGEAESCLPPRVSRAARAIAKDPEPVRVTNLLRDTEHGMWKSLDPLKIIIRVGPGLGLIGTLIPMGTGLASLGQGDLSQLSRDLVVAFTTTVVGMALGLAAYCLFTVQRRWVEQDVKNIQLAAELLASGAAAEANAANPAKAANAGKAPKAGTGERRPGKPENANAIS
ncbi:MAG: MotA/TolQ/ExbB proton channel family protein [Desulfobacter sp.]|nr:MAG: MotA/TolQ/ExbB proton channel family protein [Desulfobacter sp.]